MTIINIKLRARAKCTLIDYGLSKGACTVSHAISQLCMHVYTLYVCIRVAQIMSMGKVEQVSENLDRVLLELMSSLQQLAELRKKYGAAVREVSINWNSALLATENPHNF